MITNSIQCAAETEIALVLREPAGEYVALLICSLVSHHLVYAYYLICTESMS